MGTAPAGSATILQENNSAADNSRDRNARNGKALINEGRRKQKIVWFNVYMFIALHLSALYGVYLVFTSSIKTQTLLFAFFLAWAGETGVTAGAHRLWSHRAYKAKWQLRLLLATFQTIAFQNDVIEWVRDHRVHHKFTETDADPHNAERGFFFSHMGWLMMKKHPDVISKGKGIDLSDVENDRILAFQKKYYLWVMPLFCFVLPTIIPMLVWGESFRNAWFVPTMLRYTFSLHMTWLVNSAAHMFGDRPYDASIAPAENLLVSIGAVGEGWHNYHHVFPWDYKAAELGQYSTNWTTGFIDLMARIGWAYDLKSVSKEMVKARSERTGDSSRGNCRDNSRKNRDQHGMQQALWGWGDEDMTTQDKMVTEVH